jgi:hypothetical protein
LPSKVPPPGFGYPLGGVSFPDPWKSFPTSHALGIHPSELCSGLRIEERFRAPLPLLRFPTKPPGLVAALQRFTLPRQPYPPHLSWFNTQVGPLALLGFRPFGHSPAEPMEKLFPFPSPSRPLAWPSLSKPPDRTPGFFSQRHGISPFLRGARPFDLPGRRTPATLLKVGPAAAYFFSSES